ncbi:VOC family protein [Candidatus Uabimicrobium sp. HlEnr_7]|uniref:VOC family protein n=1 Tax=Candidatus Uabimicrobium helgolandensis TaxID=3095367 RepID=UPI0035587741
MWKINSLFSCAIEVKDPEKQIAFYKTLGMNLVYTYENHDQKKIYLLRYLEEEAYLTLVHNYSKTGNYSPKPNDNYWKITIFSSDVDSLRNSLCQQGIKVGNPKQFLDIGYLCHLHDSENYTIELLQRDFQCNFTPSSSTKKPSFGLITLRTKNIDKSLHFYQEILGMKILAKMPVSSYKFTLYFLAFTEDTPPSSDLESINNREWLYKRNYTVLELQHYWDDREINSNYDLGFLQISMACQNINNLQTHFQSYGIKTLEKKQSILNKPSFSVKDPSEICVEFIETR